MDAPIRAITRVHRAKPVPNPVMSHDNELLSWTGIKMTKRPATTRSFAWTATDAGEQHHRRS